MDVKDVTNLFLVTFFSALLLTENGLTVSWNLVEIIKMWGIFNLFGLLIVEGGKGSIK